MTGQQDRIEATYRTQTRNGPSGRGYRSQLFVSSHLSGRSILITLALAAVLLTVFAAQVSAFNGTPDTTITQVRMSIASFTSDDSAATFECDLDGAGWVSCSSPFAGPDDGSEHFLDVRAVNAVGPDPTPATARLCGGPVSGGVC